MLADGVNGDPAKLAHQFNVYPIAQVPGDRGVAQGVTNDFARPVIAGQPGPLYHGRPAFLDDVHRLGVPFDHRMIGNAKPLPTPQVGEQSWWDRNSRLPFAGFLLVVRLALED